MEKKRCFWVTVGDKLYEAYHDEEWGVPVHEDRKHFEFLVLEGAQAGLSWITILKRRENYRKAFANFDPKKVAKFDEEKIDELMRDEGIIRNKLKIKSAINNAQRFLEVQKEFGTFDKYIWSFVKGEPIQNSQRVDCKPPCDSIESKALAKDLKRRGFSFVGPLIIYAHMQAIGMINDHDPECFRHKQLS